VSLQVGDLVFQFLDAGAEFAHQSGFGWSGHGATVAEASRGVDQETNAGTVAA
jgi:hypothetical protein